MSTAQKTIGACIRALREQLGLSQETLASKAAISYQYLSGVETGKENFTIQVLDGLAKALKVPLQSLVDSAYKMQALTLPPVVEHNYFNPNVPLPVGLSVSHIEAALNLTQQIIHRISSNMRSEIGNSLQDLIQGNNFSGLVSNILSNSMDSCSPYKHNHHQRYPDLVYKVEGKPSRGLEIKTTIKVGKGGESHNGHSGWHMIACYNFLSNGDIKFVHVMLSELNAHSHVSPDWSYVGSAVNKDTGSRRTETYNTNLKGLTKLRDGSAYLDSAVVNYSRWKQQREGKTPHWSIFFQDKLPTLKPKNGRP